MPYRSNSPYADYLCARDDKEFDRKILELSKRCTNTTTGTADTAMAHSTGTAAEAVSSAFGSTVIQIANTSKDGNA